MLARWGKPKDGDLESYQGLAENQKGKGGVMNKVYTLMEVFVSVLFIAIVVVLIFLSSSILRSCKNISNQIEQDGLKGVVSDVWNGKKGD